MAFNFPSSPGIGQVFTSGGATYIWDGNKWKAVAVQLPAIRHGECRFIYISTTQCRLIPYDGNRIIVDNQEEVIPDAGINFSNAGLTPSTRYNAYVYKNSSGVLTGEFTLVTTGYTRDPRNGVTVKSGDPTRTLVGMVYVGASTSYFYDQQDIRWVASYFNRRTKSMIVGSTGSTTSTAHVNASGALYMIAWWDEPPFCAFYGTVSNSATSTYTYIRPAWNGDFGQQVYFATPGAGWGGTVAGQRTYETGSDVMLQFYTQIATSAAAGTAGSNLTLTADVRI